MKLFSLKEKGTTSQSSPMSFTLAIINVKGSVVLSVRLAIGLQSNRVASLLRVMNCIWLSTKFEAKEIDKEGVHYFI
jgi:hypothetical protein